MIPIKSNIDNTCRLYIEGNWILEEVIKFIEDATNGSRSLRTIITDMFEIDLEASLDADEMRIESEDGFLFYRFNAYVEPVLKENREQYIKSLCELISGLREVGAKVVASCEFEEDISRLTGWNWSTRTPNPL